MCKLTDINIIKSLDDIQLVITQTILEQTVSFTYNQITNEIKEELLKKQASTKLVDSFKVENMIKETLFMLINRERLNCYNNYYTPISYNYSEKKMFVYA